MPEREGTVTDLKDYGPALGRRFRGLKLWAVLRCYGREGLQALIREHVRLAQLFASWVDEEPGWEIAAPHALSSSASGARARTRQTQAILEYVNGSGEAFLSQTRLDGRSSSARDRQRADDRGRRAPRLGALQEARLDRAGEGVAGGRLAGLVAAREPARRCSEVPCVKVSGFTWPWVFSWIRSSPIAAAASRPSLMSCCVRSTTSPVSTACAAQTPA
jgi:hypothetical protein